MPALSRGQGNRPAALALGLTLLGLAASLALGWASDGFYQDDDFGHYLFAASAWDGGPAPPGQVPHSVWFWRLHEWARPGFNLPVAPVAHFFGFAGCRALSALVTALTAWLAFLIARRIQPLLLHPSPLAGEGRPYGSYEVRGRKTGEPEALAVTSTSRAIGWAWAAPLLVWLQPLAMTLSLTSLTETFAGLYLAAGLWLFLRGNRIAGCAVLSLMFVTRYETMALAPIVGIAVIYYTARVAQPPSAVRVAGVSPADALKEPSPREGKMPSAPVRGTPATLLACALALAWAPLAYAATALLTHLPMIASPLAMLTRERSTQYGHGAWTWYLLMWAQAAGAGVLAMWLCGLAAAWRRGWLLIAMTLGLVAVHTVLFHYGMFESGGYGRFLVPLAGIIAPVAAIGLERISRHATAAALALLALTLAPVLVNVHVPWLIRPVLAHPWIFVPLGLAALLAAFAKKLRSVVVGLGLLAVVGITLVQPGVQVRPLRLDSDPLYAAIRQAAAKAKELGYGEAPAITGHVIVPALHPGARVSYNTDNSIDAWQTSRPGTLFFWDSKYAGDATGNTAKSQLLLDELRRLGRQIAEAGDQTNRVRVYMRE